MKHPDDMYFELDWNWYEYMLEEFENELKDLGFDVRYQTVRGNQKDAEPCIFFDDYALAFDADVDWPCFFLNDKTVAETFTAFFMLASANPTYYKAEVRRTGNRSLGMDCELAEYDISCDYHGDDLVKAGFFKGMTIESVARQINCEAVADYVLAVAKGIASEFKKRLDAEYEYQLDEIVKDYTQSYNEWIEESRKRALYERCE